MKRIFVVHGWSSAPDQHWSPWLKTKLKELGFEVFEPLMPNPDEPIIETWVNYLSEQVGELDEQTYFIGHSIGCQTILRYLETQAGKKAGGCVFVAGWFFLENMESEEEEQIALPWLKHDIDFEKVLSTTKKFVVINSSNDDYGHVEDNKRMFEEKLGARVIMLENKGHITQGDGVTELPEAFKAIQEMVNSNI